MAVRNFITAMVVAFVIFPNYCFPSEIVVFGLPLGGEISPYPKACSKKNYEIDVKTTCWVSKQENNNKKGAFGIINVPGRASRPKWAEYASFTISVNKGNNSVKRIIVDTFDSSKQDEIVKSISSRFGPPSNPYSNKVGFITDWTTKDAHIKMSCLYQENKCTVEFLSSEEANSYFAEMAKRDGVDKARKVSP